VEVAASLFQIKKPLLSSSVGNRVTYSIPLLQKMKRKKLARSESLIQGQKTITLNSNLDAEVPRHLEKKFHFQEINWIITFPGSGNKGKKYPDYLVLLSVLKNTSLNEKVRLIDIVENIEFQERFPHTVGFFKSETNESPCEGLNYLELRIVGSVEELWKFLNDLDL
jgi:hypothetical protein